MEYSPKKDKENQSDENKNEEEDEESSLNLNDYKNCEIIEEEFNKKNGEVGIRKYYKGNFLGKGAYAQCYEFICRENEKVFAGKIIPKSSLDNSRNKQKLIDEINIHKSLYHHNIVKFEHYFEDKENVYILLELCTNKTMHDLLKIRKHLTELEVQCYMMQLIKALNYLQNKMIIHRDLKLSNIFLSEKMELKLGDFGLATQLDFEFEKRRNLCGTPNYIAPEILNEEPYSYEVDIWSLGIIIYTLIIGRHPFDSDEEKKIYKKIKNLKYSFPENIPISDAAKDLIKKILVLNPSRRPNLYQILAHDFFKLGIDIPKLLPTSTLTRKPDIDYIRQFMPEADENGIVIKIIDVTNLLGKKLEDKLKLESNEEVFNDNDQKIKYPNIWVKKWIDYSKKYGFGYAFNTGNFGFCFNDSTKMILNPETKIFFYIKRKEFGKQREWNKYNLDNYPEELKNKVNILIYFKDYLEKEIKKSDSKNEIENENEKKYEEKIRKQYEEYDKNKNKTKKEDKDEPFIYIRSWLKTKNAIYFKFSENKFIQLIFDDNTDIFVIGESRMVIYVNKKRERITYPLCDGLYTDNREINIRMKHFKDIMVYLLKKSIDYDIFEQNAILDEKLRENYKDNSEEKDIDTEQNLTKEKKEDEKEEK